jgi:ligand-binding sensor domain-containing protein
MSCILFHSPLHKLWMKIPRRRTLFCFVALLLLVVGTFTTAALLSAHQALRRAETAVSEDTNLKFVERPYEGSADRGFESLGSPALFSQAVEFEGNLYIAGQSGLFEYDERGHELREFRVGRELPPSPLLRIARATLSNSQQPELVIATANGGVLVFDGVRFLRIFPQDREARSITSILPLASGQLLVGTLKRGVLIYDGHSLRSLHPTLTDAHITELAGSETDLWIGTLDRGVGHFHGGSVEWFSENDGLPDARVYAIAIRAQKTYVGTPNGIAEFDNGRFIGRLVVGMFVRSMLVEDRTLLAGTMDDGIVEIPLVQSTRPQRSSTSSADLMEVEQLFPSGGSVYALTRAGVFARNGTAGWKHVLEPNSGLLSDGDISALAADSRGRLWIGYFDHGLDIVENIDQEQKRSTRHIEDDHLFCINRIRRNPKLETTAVATANGLVLFDDEGIRRQVLGRADGLIADHVTDIAAYGDGIVAATPAGLTFIDADGLRSIYGFQGLVNNHVYALATDGRRLLAGTLGGASLLDDDQVRVNYTTATSTLKHNWITAALHAGDDWWIGTYGAGVMRMNDKESVRFEPANGASGDLIVNPGAMLATDRVIIAGTMGHGLYVMDRNNERWTQISEGLPSMNVTALATANGYIYIGTDNGLVRVAERSLLE